MEKVIVYIFAILGGGLGVLISLRFHLPVKYVGMIFLIASIALGIFISNKISGSKE